MQLFLKYFLGIKKGARIKIQPRFTKTKLLMKTVPILSNPQFQIAGNGSLMF